MSSQEFFKAVLVGESNVGKTCVISQYVSNEFNSESQQTTGAKYFSKEIELADKSIKLDIWDTAGQQKFRSLCKLFIIDSKAIILIYDYTDENSFKEIKDYWYTTYKDYDAIFFVVANKCDLENKKVKDEEGKEFADSIGANFFSISAKDNIGISELFQKVGETLI